MRHTVQRLQFWIKALMNQRTANVTFTFAMLAVPIVGAVGAAVDYSRANAARTAMQMALDSAALTLGKEADALSTANLNQRANSYFKAMFKRSDANGVALTSAFDAGTETLTLNATASVDTSFTRLI